MEADSPDELSALVRGLQVALNKPVLEQIQKNEELTLEEIK